MRGTVEHAAPSSANAEDWRNSRREVMRSQLATPHRAHRVVGGTSGERHVGERWILAGRARHAGTVGNEKVGDVVRLVVRVQYRGPWVAAHARRPHLVNAETHRSVVVVNAYVGATGRFQHLGRLHLHV